MKKISTLIGLLLACSPFLHAQISGGPDAFGYTYQDSDEPNGPTYAWLNILDVGVEVTGLTDDNASVPIPMGMDFHYYWYDVDQVVIGSNGWISFENTSNIAHCFPTVPTAGGPDNYLAPFMTDLIMNASGTAAEVYYWYDGGDDRFVVSYIDVPWWQSASPGYIGSNTFQIILSNQDSTITFQYQNMDQASLADNTGCFSDLVVGLENVTGNIGLDIPNYTEVVPPDNYAIKFYPPETVTLSIPDATPLWNQNAENKGMFVESGIDFAVQTTIKNVGNTDIATDINVDVELEDLSFVTGYTGSDVVAGLAAGASSTLAFSTMANVAPGQYYFNTSVSNADDINPSNNTQVTEVNAVDLIPSDVVLSYATQNPAVGQVSWTGGGGMGVYYEPPSYPATLNSVDMFIVAGINGASAFDVEVLDADGPNGLPSTILESVTVAANSYAAGAWINIPLNTPVVVNSGGVYIAFQHGVDGVALGTEMTGPISHQTYEYVGGSWATYRLNDDTEVLINGHFDIASTVGIDDPEKEASLLVQPNPNNGQFEVYVGNASSNATLEVLNPMGALVHYKRVNIMDRSVLDLSKHTKGIYFVRLVDGELILTQKVVVR